MIQRKWFYTKKTIPHWQACRKVLKFGGAIALEPAKCWGAKRRAMYLNLEIWGAIAPPAPAVPAGLAGTVIQGM